MEKSELYELIESYLNHSLPEAQRKEVEQRIANDEDFRREVDLHTDLQKNFGDPARWRLRSTLLDVMKEPEVAEAPSAPTGSGITKQRWAWIVLVGIGICLMVGLFFWLRPSVVESPGGSPTEVVPPMENSSPVIKEETDSIATNPVEENTSTKEQPEQPLLMAVADPADFTPNPSMEALVNSVTRGQDDISLTLTSPSNESVFTPDAKGETLVRFSGNLEAASNDPPAELALHIFTTKNVASALLLKKLKVNHESAASTFDMQHRMKLPYGLYYFTIEHNDDVLYAGKFNIGQLK